MHESRKHRAGRWAFVAVTTVLAAGALVLLGRIVLFYFPWRTPEVRILSAIALASAASASWLSARRPKLRVTWIGVLGLGWLLVGAAYAFSYRTNYRENIRPVNDYVDLSQTSDSASKPGSDELARHYASRPAVPLDELPRLHLGWSDMPDLEAEARELMASQYSFMSLPAVALPDDLDWDEDPYESHPWRWRLHNMAYIVTLTRAYATTGHLPYLQRAEALVLDWIDDNSGYPLDPPTQYVWNDHSTALRLANWLFFWEVWAKSPEFTPEKMNRVLGSMLGHSERLSDPSFYWENHNHGIDQDRALLGFARVFPELRTADEWRDLALRRLSTQLGQTISSNGVHLEHSPGYHVDIMERLQDLEPTLRRFDFERRMELDLDTLQSRMARYLGITVQPNGRIAPVGDTKMIDLKATSVWHHEAAFPWLEYYLTAGNSGTLYDTVAAYPEEGYAVIRDFDDGTVPFRQSLYLFFTAAANEVTGRRGHKHADDLSFILSYRGHEFLIDAGLYGYERDRNRDHVVGARAHNVVLIDGESFSGWDSSLEGFETTPAYTMIRASHRNYPGFDHTRWIVHLPPTKFVLVDDVRPDPSDPPARHDHTFEQLLHFGPTIAVEATGGDASIVATATTGKERTCPQLRVTQLHGAVDAHIAAGQREPMLGWYSPAIGSLEPSPAVSFRTEGSGALYVTLFDLADCDRLPLSRSSDALAEASDDGSLMISWEDEVGSGRLAIDREADNLRVTRD